MKAAHLVEAGEAALRFPFGRNWTRFLASVDERRVARAEASLLHMLGPARLDGLTFLDVGSGSGLFSLAARRLGARVHAFDFDPESVAAAQALRHRFRPDDEGWTIERGSALDEAYLASLGRFDVVYAWGVLHHTGDLWRALDLVAGRVAPRGRLFVAVYNDQGGASRRWAAVKRLYNRLPSAARPLVTLPAFAWIWGRACLIDLLKRRPFHSWRHYDGPRGMSPWRDLIDWVGGYPFEVARPEAVFDACRARGFALERLKTCRGGKGCNEFVFSCQVERSA